MPDVKISQLPTRQPSGSDFIPVVDSAGTSTSKVSLNALPNIGTWPPNSHAHGSITNAGALSGAAANTPLITGTGGAIQAGSFGTAANTFCQGNDPRLTDSRTPVAHKSSHTSQSADFIDLIVATTDISSNQVAWAPAPSTSPATNAADVVRINPTVAGLSIAGMLHAINPKAILLVNVGSHSITLLHDSTTATNQVQRFLTTTAQNFTLPANGFCAVWYDDFTQRWRVLG